MDSWYTGSRECPSARTTRRASATVSVSATHTMSMRGTMTSRATVSPNSKMEWIISRSSSWITPSSSPTFTSRRISSSVTSGEARSTRPPSGQSSRLLSSDSTRMTGESSTVSQATGRDTHMARRSAYFAANVLGVISPTTRSSSVIPIKAYSGPRCGPHTWTRIAVAKTVAATLTMLFPTSSAVSTRPGSSRSRRTVPARALPCSWSCRSRSLLAASSAVSDPEKKADRTSNNARTT